MNEGTAALVAAARAVHAVAHERRSADDVLGGADDDRAERSAVRAIAFGTLRWYLRLAPAIARLLDRPAARIAPAVHALLVTAAHQIVYSRNAPQGIVDAAVDATRALGAARASGFANAVLRRFVREHASLFAQLDADPAVRHAHPRWLVDVLEREVLGQIEDVLAGGNVRAPMTLRVDLSRTTRAQAQAVCAARGIAATPLEGYAAALVLETPVPVDSLPGFAEGWLSVQDAGAQLAAVLLAPEPGMRVLDACAAPGGKTAHLLEVAGGDLDLLAVDSDAGRLARVGRNLERLGRHARLAQLDLRDPAALAGEAPFDRILVDAPCSATGVIRRHPDIKLLRRPSDIAAFARTQLAILGTCFARLAPGGRLLYATCSILAAENGRVIERFLDFERGARLAGTAVQLWPGVRAATDGFHYASLTKAPPT
ncbi:MAG: 16S rRNA (cytosine(967)-C(5))-methyltransferase RsmB [Steroidobacteraceae bacterium]